MPPGDRRTGPTAYRQAQVRARELVGSIQEEAADDVQRALNQYADEIANGLGNMGPEAQRLSERILRQSSARLGQAVEASVQGARSASYNDVQAIWREAAEKVANARGVPGAMMGAVRVPPLSLLGAYEGLGSSASTWKTLAGKYAGEAAKDVDGVVRAALLKGTSPERLARSMRPYVAGSATVKDLVRGLPGVSLTDLRGASREALGAAGRMRFNARRIAFSELHNARAEAEVFHFAADPNVKGVGWRLSPSRGSVVVPDECDALASQDFYGMGPGVYPVHAVPFPPHPFDRCERVPITRGLDEVGTPKPRPNLKADPSDISIPNGHKITQAKGDRIRGNLRNLFRETERLGPIEALQDLSVSTLGRQGAGPVFSPTMDTLDQAREAASMRDLNGWSKGKIADEMGLSKSRINELLKIEKQHRWGIARSDISGRVTLDELDDILRNVETPGPTFDTIEEAQKALELKRSGLTNAEVAEQLGVSSSRISELRKIGRQWENGVPVPKISGRLNNAEVDELIQKFGFGGSKTVQGGATLKPKTKKKNLKTKKKKKPPTGDDEFYSSHRDAPWHKKTSDDIQWSDHPDQLKGPTASKSGPPHERYTAHAAEAFEGAHDEALTVVNRLNRPRSATMTTVSGKGSFYRSWQKHIEVNVKQTRWPAVLRHEYGHHVDRMLSEIERATSPGGLGRTYWSSGGRFAKALDEFEDQMKNDAGLRARVRGFIRDVTNGTSYEKGYQGQVRDIFGSVTSKWQTRIGGGHPVSYYEDNFEHKYVEPFAQFFSLWSDPTKAAFDFGPKAGASIWNAMRREIPEMGPMMDAFEDKMDEIARRRFVTIEKVSGFADEKTAGVSGSITKGN